MIEISFGKLVVLALIALIVLGPEKLPGAARTAGALIRRMRTSWEGVRAEVERELQVEELKRTAREAAAHAQAAQSELNATMSRVRGAFSDTPPAAAPAVAAETPATPAQALPQVTAEPPAAPVVEAHADADQELPHDRA